MPNKMAVLVDGAFFLYRFKHVYDDKKANDAEFVAETMHKMACAHLYLKKSNKEAAQQSELYRIFFYDCPPLMKGVHNPISNTYNNFEKSNTAIFRCNLHKELVNFRKVALRLGFLNSEHANWQLKPRVLKSLLKKEISFDDLSDSDFLYDVKQKQIDMKIGLDIAGLAYKKQVDQIVLVSGDSDFVPAAKIARREGIDFILDPMWHNIKPDLLEHIDGLRSTSPKPK